MDDIVNRLARELADAIAAAVADDPQVEACREKARAAGFEMRVTLEAVVGFVNRTSNAGGAPAKVATPAKVVAARLRATGWLLRRDARRLSPVAGQAGGRTRSSERR